MSLNLQAIIDMKNKQSTVIISGEEKYLITVRDSYGNVVTKKGSRIYVIESGKEYTVQVEKSYV